MSDKQQLPFGDELPYWKTSKSSPESWIEKTVNIIKKLGGQDIGEAFGAQNGTAAFMVSFKIDNEWFRVVWPVLRVRKPEDERAARVQSATLMYHDCKAKSVSAMALGVRNAFVGQLVLPSGKTVEQEATPLIEQYVKPVGLIGN